MKNILLRTLFITALLVASVSAKAEDVKNENYILSIKDHKFSPQELVLPADKKIKLVVKNLDATPAEFESSDLNREKIVGANSEITVNLGPLKAGTYGFFDDFNRKTTTGTFKVK